MKKKLKNNNKKGSSAIEFVFGLLVFVILVGFTSDIVVITNKQYVVSQTANEIVRQMSLQGGIKRTTPVGFPGGTGAYTSSAELKKLLDSRFADEGIKVEEWNLELTEYDASGYLVSKKTLSNTTNFEIDYRNNFDIKITYNYHWGLLGNIVPTMSKDRTVEQKRSAVSEFKYDYNDWKGEKL